MSTSKLAFVLGAAVLVAVPAFLYASVRSGSRAAAPALAEPDSGCCLPGPCCDTSDPACAEACAKICEIACEASAGDPVTGQEICEKLCAEQCAGAKGCAQTGEGVKACEAVESEEPAPAPAGSGEKASGEEDGC